MDIDQQIAILNAAKTGEKIECRRYGEGQWSAHIDPLFNFIDFQYRKKPREPREVWINHYPSDMVMHATQQEARSMAGIGCIETVRYREVL